jgi:hypothetical protein
MPAGGICPQCRSNVSPVARFCARCGLEQVASEARAAWNFAAFVGFFLGIALLFLTVAGVIVWAVGSVHTSVQSSQTLAQSYAAAAATDLRRQQLLHANDPWWDPTQLDELKASYYGEEYRVGPGEWTVVDVRTPLGSERFRYVVELEGIDRFIARPDGKAGREYVYPNRENLQPYQMSGVCQTLWVKSGDGGVHQVRLKYVRKLANQSDAGY